MSHDPYGHRRPGPPPPPPPPMPPYAVPPQKQRGKGCLYGFIGGVAMLFLMVACGAIVASSGGSGPASTSGGSAGSGPAEGTAGGNKGDEKDKPKKVKNGIGREYRDGKFAFTVTKVKKGVKKVGNEYFGDKAQGQFVIVHVTVKNIGDDARTFTGTNQTLIDAKGREFEADPEAAVWTNQKSKSFFEQINPGNKVKGQLIYDVPRGAKLKAIELHDSMFSGGVTVPLGGR